MSVAAALERLRASSRPRVLFVSHAHGGGVARHLGDLVQGLERGNRAHVLLLTPYGKSYLHLRPMGAAAGESFDLWLRKDEWEEVLRVLAGIGIDRVHIHHVHGLPSGVLELPARLARPYDLTLHDYFPACPSYHLVNGGGRFCGGQPSCHRCGEAHPTQWDLTIDEWRERFAPLLRGAERLIAPSQDAARRIASFFPEARPVVWPHPDDTSAPTAIPRRVLVPGAISPAKGLALLEACVRDAAARGLPLHFRVLGYTATPIPAWPELPFSLAGEYEEGRLEELVTLERGDAFFFPAQCAETFSYTLSTALATALPIVATDLGALPERLAGRANARVLAWDSPAAAFNDALMAVVAPAASPFGAPAALPSIEEYGERYAAAFSRSALAPQATLPAIDPRWLARPADEPSEWTLEALIADAFANGRASSRRTLAELAPQADRQLAELKLSLALTREEIARRDAAAAASGPAAPSSLPPSSRPARLRALVRRLLGGT